MNCFLLLCFFLSVDSIGSMFHFFMYEFASPGDKKKLIALHESHTDATDTEHQVTVSRLVKTYRRAWYTKVLTSLNLRGRAANFQMFYLTMLLHFRGLSKNGSSFLHKLGLSLSDTTFRRYRRLVIEQQQAYLE